MTAGQGAITNVAVRTFTLRLALAGLAMIASIVISRLLGPTGRGIYYIPIIAAGTLISLAKLGVDQTNVYLYGSRSIAAERLASHSTVIALGMGALAMVVMLLLPPFFPSTFADVTFDLLLLGALTIPLSLHTQLIAGLQNLVGQITLQFRAALIGGALQVALLLALAGAGAITVATVLAANLIGLAVSWFWTMRRSSFTAWSLKVDGPLLGETIRHSIVLHIGLVLFYLHLRVDTFMVKSINGTEALGIYSLAVVLAETILLATDSVSIAILPRQATIALKESAIFALTVSRLNAYVASACAVVAAALGWIAIPMLFGSAFSSAYAPLAVLLPGIVFLSMQRVFGAPALRTGSAWRITGIYAVSLASNIMLNALWLPAFGPVGASLASTLSYALSLLLFAGWTISLAGSASALRPQRSDLALLSRFMRTVVSVFVGDR